MARMWLMGLSGKQVEDRWEIYGHNEISRADRYKFLRILLSQWQSPLVWMLGVAAAITGIWGDLTDMWLILAAVILNTVIGFVQEFRVEKSLEALKSVLAPRAEVIRDGKRQMVAAEAVVPGDILFVSNAHKVAADGIVLSSDGIFTLEAVLTGESEAVAKVPWAKAGEIVDIELALSTLRETFGQIESKHKVFMGTEVTVGVGKVLVVHTGESTEIGQISKKLAVTKEAKTPLQKKITRLTRSLAVGVLAVTGFVIVSGLATGKEWITIFPLAVALAVAALPEGLTLSLTVILAIGMRRILKKGGVVRRLAAAEALGAVQVICADKTGTITQGQMTVTGAVTNLSGEMIKEEHHQIVLDAILCNDLRDPLEIAMNEWANKHLEKLGREIKVGRWRRIDSRPFDHREKTITTLLEWSGKDNLLLISGAPEVVLKKTKLSGADQSKWLEQMRKLALKGYRLVGFAGKTTADKTIQLGKKMDLSWHGFLVYEDPIRDGVKEAFEKVKESGVMVKVITGDYKETGMAILNQLGILGFEETNKVITGEEMTTMTPEELTARIEEVVLFARTNPEEKLRIVEALQAKGYFVAMTGDGINDAPALKRADVGIVVAEATEVAKETADMVLIKSDFATIVEAVEEGRAILVNFRKVVTYLLADAFAGIVVVIGSLILGWPLPLVAAQILWINLISDGFPYLALTLEPKDDNLLARSPKDFGGMILTPVMVAVMVTISLVAGGLTLFIFGWYWIGKGADLSIARTMAMAMLGANSLFYVFSTKSLDKAIWDKGNKVNRWLWAGVGLGFAMILTAIYWEKLAGLLEMRAIGLFDWWWVLVGTVVVIISAESVKLLRRVI